MSRRVERINEQLRQEISQLLLRQINDPRLGGLITVTQVHTSSDLRSALVLLSVMGDTAAKQSALEGVQSAAAFIRRELRGRLALRHTPFLRFSLDESMEQGEHLLRIMDGIRDSRVGTDYEAADQRQSGPSGPPQGAG